MRPLTRTVALTKQGKMWEKIIGAGVGVTGHWDFVGIALLIHGEVWLGERVPGVGTRDHNLSSCNTRPEDF